MSEEPKKIEIVSGDTSDLNISPVYDHLNTAKPKIKDKKKEIVVPGIKKKNNDKNDKSLKDSVETTEVDE